MAEAAHRVVQRPAPASSGIAYGVLIQHHHGTSVRTSIASSRIIRSTPKGNRTEVTIGGGTIGGRVAQKRVVSRKRESAEREVFASQRELVHREGF
jgi:hypothetical protein